MPVTRLRPNAFFGINNSARTGGTSIQDALSDQSDASYVRRSAGTSGNSMVCVELGTTTISADERVVSVVPGMRYKLAATDGKPCAVRLAQVYSRAQKTYWNAQNVAYGQALAITDAIGSAVSGSPFAPSGKHWSQETLDDLLIHACDSHAASYTNRAYVYELFADVYTVEKALVAVSGPSGTITTTSFPPITVNVSAVVEAWQVNVPGVGDFRTGGLVDVRVYTADQAAAPGFDPFGTGTEPLWQTTVHYQNNVFTDGVTPSVAPVTVVPDSPLPNGALRAYARASREAPGVDFYSDWDYTPFTMNLTPPDLNAFGWADPAGQPDSIYMAVEFDTTAVDPTVSVERYDITRASVDSTVGWEPLLGMTDVAPEYLDYGGGSTEYYIGCHDFEAPRGHAVKYRFRITSTVSAQRLTGEWIEITDFYGEPLIPAVGEGWTFCVINRASIPGLASPGVHPGYVRGTPAYGVQVVGDLPMSRSEDAGVFTPAGRSRPVVVSGTIRGADGTYTILTDGGDGVDAGIGDFELGTSIAATEVFANSQDPILVIDAFNRSKWIRIVERSFVQTGTTTNPRRTYTLRYLEVDRPV